MKQKLLSILSCFLLFFATAQKKITISGYINDVKTGEAIIGASVYNTNEKKGVATNNYGFYSLTVTREDTLGLIISVIGYKPQLKKINANDNIELNIQMEESEVEALSEVVVSSVRTDKNVRKAQMSIIDVPMKQIRTLPA